MELSELKEPNSSVMKELTDILSNRNDHSGCTSPYIKAKVPTLKGNVVVMMGKGSGKFVCCMAAVTRRCCMLIKYWFSNGSPHCFHLLVQNGPGRERYSLALARNPRTNHANSNPLKEQGRRDQLAAKLRGLGLTALELAVSHVCGHCNDYCLRVPSACGAQHTSTGTVGIENIKTESIITCVAHERLKVVKNKSYVDVRTRNKVNRKLNIEDNGDKVSDFWIYSTSALVPTCFFALLLRLFFGT